MSDPVIPVSNKDPNFHRNAMPKQTFDYLCTVFPNGWVLLYTYPVTPDIEKDKDVDEVQEGMVISTAIKPTSILVPIVRHLQSITSS